MSGDGRLRRCVGAAHAAADVVAGLAIEKQPSGLCQSPRRSEDYAAEKYQRGTSQCPSRRTMDHL